MCPSDRKKTVILQQGAERRSNQVKKKYTCIMYLKCSILVLKGLIHFYIKFPDNLLTPHVIQDVYLFFSSVEKKLRFLIVKDGLFLCTQRMNSVGMEF